MDDLRQRDEKFQTFIFLPLLKDSDMTKPIKEHILKIFKEEASILFLRNLNVLRVLKSSQCELMITKTIFKKESEAQATHMLDVSRQIKHGESQSGKETTFVLKQVEYLSCTTSSQIDNVEASENWWIVKAILEMAMLENCHETHSNRTYCYTDVVFCFPFSGCGVIQHDNKFNVHAFLPVPGCATGGGFSFLIHADWNLTASRDSVEEDDGGWNSALLRACAELFAYITIQNIKNPDHKMLDHYAKTVSRTQGSTLSNWWRGFTNKVQDLVTGKCDCFHVSREIEKEIINLFPTYADDLNLIIVDNHLYCRFPPLDIVEVLSRYRSEHFVDQHENPDWWVMLFISLKRHIEMKRSEGFKLKLVSIFKTKPILQFYGFSYRQNWNDAQTCLNLLWSKDSTISAALLCDLLPHLHIICYQSEEERDCLLTLDFWKVATTDVVVRLVLMAHGEMNADYGKETLINSIRFLFANRDALIAEFKGNEHGYAGLNAQRLRLCMPVNDGAVLSSDAIVPLFKIHPGADSSNHVCLDLFENLSDSDQALMAIFLLEVGCKLPDGGSEIDERVLCCCDIIFESLRHEQVVSVLNKLQIQEISATNFFRVLQRLQDQPEIYFTFLSNLQAVLRSLSEVKLSRSHS